MNITLKMKLQDQEFNLIINMTMNAGRIYRQQFQRDLVKDLSELYEKFNPSIFDNIDLKGIETEGKAEEEITQQIITRAYPVWAEAQKKIIPSYEDIERTGQILWAFAKNADMNLPGYEKWIDEFDYILPTKEIVIALYGAWNDSAKPTVEIKN